MLKSRFYITVVLLLVVFTSCKNNNQEAATAAIKVEGLTLNQGVKWLANEETHVGMQNIKAILNNQTPTSKEALTKALSKETSFIIKSCNMEGEAHDQLHLVLVPILEDITALKEANNQANINPIIERLKGLVVTYFNFFQT